LEVAMSDNSSSVFRPQIPVVESETGEVIELFETHGVAQRYMDALNKRAVKNGTLAHGLPPFMIGEPV
jgi:hypothetical protein